MKKHLLKAEKRKLLGSKVKSLRREGSLPANLYGKKIKSQALQLKVADFSKVLHAAGETGIVDLALGAVKTPVLIANVQYHPVDDNPIHVDFRAVDLKEKVVASVPVEVVGESPAEKSGVGTLVVQLTEIEVEALPADLPEKFEIDATKLTEVDQAVFIKDLDYDKAKVEPKADPEQLVVKVEPPQKEEVVIVPEETEGEEGEAEGEEKPEGEGKEDPSEKEEPDEKEPSEDKSSS